VAAQLRLLFTQAIRGLFRHGEECARVGEQVMPRLGQTHAMGVAQEEGRLGFFFQRAQVATQRRL